MHVSVPSADVPNLSTVVAHDKKHFDLSVGHNLSGLHENTNLAPNTVTATLTDHVQQCIVSIPVIVFEINLCMFYFVFVVGWSRRVVLCYVMS